MNDPGRTTHPDKPGVEQCGAFHKHKKRPGRHKPDTGCDAEARLLYTYAKRQSKEPLDMVFKIDWRNADGNHAIPCPDCFRMMCHAKTNCNVKIYVCNKENRPIELDNECENDDYEGFTRRINKMGGK
ncbi:MAG: hypothetical protein FWG14_14285 [Peptococcaceae bacterium]|nr:hypothetical protein [Peptococcaceae bacterium]